MASATGIPQLNPEGAERDETEPLLGRPGDASQPTDGWLIQNVVIGTGLIAELAALLFFVLIWASVFLSPLMLFSVHPLAQSAGLLLLTQSILVLQPTNTASQKAVGQKVHAGLNLLAFSSFLVGVVVIEYNKFRSDGPHFHSVHGYLGVIASIFILVQYLVGFTMFATPKLYGGVDKAKANWKYHRISGYFLYLLLLATVISAVDTDFNKNVLKLKMWAVVLLSVLVVIGIFPRIKKYKLGF